MAPQNSRLSSEMVVVPQAIQTPQLSTGLPAVVDAADECIRSAIERPARAVLRDAVQNAGCEMRGIEGISKGEEKGSRSAPYR